MLQQWYIEAKSHPRVAKFHTDKADTLLYKGFKIALDLESGELVILDIRKTDFYNEVLERDLVVIKEHGFIKGCDSIMSQRDEARVGSYTKRLEKLYSLKEEYSKDSIKNKKKLGICLVNIAESIDSLFFYKSRLIQNKEKYEESKV